MPPGESSRSLYYISVSCVSATSPRHDHNACGLHEWHPQARVQHLLVTMRHIPRPLPALEPGRVPERGRQLPRPQLRVLWSQARQGHAASMWWASFCGVVRSGHALLRLDGAL